MIIFVGLRECSGTVMMENAPKLGDNLGSWETLYHCLVLWLEQDISFVAYLEGTSSILIGILLMTKLEVVARPSFFLRMCRCWGGQHHRFWKHCLTGLISVSYPSGLPHQALVVEAYLPWSAPL